MSNDISVVQRFVGNYISDGKFDPITPITKRDWVPKKGVRMTIFPLDLVDDEGKDIGAYAMVTISQFPAKLSIERAIYRVAGDSLVAADIPLTTGLLVTETLRAITRTNTLGIEETVAIEHNLKFSDGQPGKWICPK